MSDDHLIQLMYAKWIAAGENAAVRELEGRIKAGSTGGEIIDLIGEYLVSIRKQKGRTYTVARKEIDSWLWNH